MSTGTPYPYDRDLWTSIAQGTTHDALARCRQVEAENAMLRTEMAAREARAYEHGLGDAAKVYRENRILAATIAALTDRQHPMVVR